MLKLSLFEAYAREVLIYPRKKIHYPPFPTP